MLVLTSKSSMTHRWIRQGLLAATPLMTMAGCDRGPNWWCQTEAAAQKHGRGRPMCTRKGQYCKGTCEPKQIAYCFAIGSEPYSGGGYGSEGPAERGCYVEEEACNEGRRLRMSEQPSPCIQAVE